MNRFIEIFPRKFSDNIFFKSGHVHLLDGVVTHYQGRNQVYGIRDRDHRPGIPGHKSWDQDQPFFVCVFEGSGIELFRYFIINEKLEYFVQQGKRPLFRSIEKA